MSKRSVVRWGALLGYIACIPLANWLIVRFGVVPVGFGLLAPAGVYAAGAAFTLRDLVQETSGRRWAVFAVFAGALLSLVIAPTFAFASAVAFLVSEGLDLLVYTPLRSRHWIGAIVASNTVGLVVDSIIFLALAFGSLDFLAGQLVGKAWMTALAALTVWSWRLARKRMVAP
jgi:uncharacterized PurR-regulated membrane protein YhhQ (DUF165 family)